MDSRGSCTVSVTVENPAFPSSGGCLRGSVVQKATFECISAFSLNFLCFSLSDPTYTLSLGNSNSLH